MSDLDDIWAIQYQQQQMWHDWGALSTTDREHLVKDLLLLLNEETSELQRCMDQSRYHILKREASQSPDLIAEHGADIIKTTVALLLLGGVAPDQFMEAFKRKTDVVKAKWEWEQASMKDVEVLLCDIDGCLADWATAFEAHCQARGQSLAPGSLNLPELEDIKDHFHSSGGFRELAQIEGAVAVLNHWRHSFSNGPVQIKRKLILVTARPYRRHRRIYTDTVSWCEAMGLKQDHILFESDKAEAVRLVSPARIVCMIEDRGKHALEVAQCGVKVLKLPHRASEEAVKHPNITEVTNWRDIADILRLKVPGL